MEIKVKRLVCSDTQNKRTLVGDLQRASGDLDLLGKAFGNLAVFGSRHDGSQVNAQNARREQYEFTGELCCCQDSNPS